MVKTVNGLLQARDTIASNKGTVTMRTANEVIKMAEVTKLELKISKKKETVKTLGNNWTGHKATSVEGTGSMEGYWISSMLIQHAKPFLENGEDVYFDITTDVEDKTSTAGRQSVTVFGANFNDIPIAELEADDGLLKFKSDLTFEGMTLNNAFN